MGVHCVSERWVKESKIFVEFIVYLFTADQFVKHYMIDASAGEYTFLGPGQPSFKTLEQLLSHYKYA